MFWGFIIIVTGHIPGLYSLFPIQYCSSCLVMLLIHIPCSWSCSGSIIIIAGHAPDYNYYLYQLKLSFLPFFLSISSLLFFHFLLSVYVWCPACINNMSACNILVMLKSSWSWSKQTILDYMAFILHYDMLLSPLSVLILCGEKMSNPKNTSSIIWLMARWRMLGWSWGWVRNLILVWNKLG